MVKFEKVSFEEFYSRMIQIDKKYDMSYLSNAYENIKLPKRSTIGSAGYDFFTPIDVNYDLQYIKRHKDSNKILVPTGVRFVTDRKDLFLMCVPRSGLGFKYGFSLVNTTGIIDSDYFNPNCEGHIMLKFCADESFSLKSGDAIMQGIITTFVKTDDDVVTETRIGGFGSTDKK